MPTLDLGSALVALIGNVFLGLFTYLKNPKSATNRLFFFFSTTLALYLIFNYLALHQSSDQATLFFVRSIMSVAVVLNLLFFLLVRSFPKPTLDLSKKILYLSILGTLLLLLITQTGLIFSAVIRVGSGYDSIPGSGMPLFLLHTLVFIGGGIYELIVKLRKSSGIEKIQIRFLLLGVAMMFALILTTNLILVILFNTSKFIGLLPAYTLIFVGAVSYAIVRHRFLDIHLVVARTVSYTLLVGVLGLSYALFFGVISSLFINSGVETTIIASTLLAMLMAFTFQPLRGYLEKITDKILYKNHYDVNQLLYNLTLIMASTLRLEDLTHQLLVKLITEMRLTRGAFILTQQEKVAEIIHEGYSANPEVDEEKILELMDQPRLLIFEELPEGEVKSVMRDAGLTLVTQLRTEGELIGFLALGEKLSGDIYSEGDIRVLDIITPEAAVAIQNSKAYEEISRFNITLQEEVERATTDLKVANERLHELDLLKSEFVSVASHELRTPMTAIKSYMWMALAGKGGAITDKQKYYLERAYISTDRLIKLVNDLLNVSRIESGRMSLDVQKLSLGAFVDEVISEVKPRADELGIKIENAVDPNNPPPEVIADVDKIKEVMINLIGNSLKFTPQSGTIKIWFEKADDLVVTHVQDSGEGISPDDIPKLFQKFGLVRGSYVTNQKASQGTGLGLYISKSIVELHGGKMWAASDGHGKGATFSFSLPIFTQQKLEEIQGHQSQEGLGIIHSTID